MKKIPDEELDKLSKKIMAGNKATIKKIINEWLRDGSKISCDFFFDTFTKRSSKKILGVLSIDNVKNLIRYELEKQLRYKFKNNKKVASFQKIVDHAIKCVERCIDERIKTYIPMWLIDNYKYIKDEKVLTSEEVWYDRIKKKNKSYEEINQDAYELVDLLEYHKYLREEMVRLSDPIINRASRRKKADVKKDLVKLESTVLSHLESAKISDDVKKYIIDNKFIVEDEMIKLYLKQLRKDFEAFVLYEKYGHVPDEFYSARDDITKLIREPSVCLDYMEELDCLDIKDFNLNTITVDLTYKQGKKRAMDLWKSMEENPNVKIYKTGSTGNKFYLIYDYCAPKKWFNEKTIRGLENKIDCWLSKKPLEIEAEVLIDFDFPYYSDINTQFRMSQNYAIFCSKLKLTGLSAQKDYNPFNSDGFTYRTINPYQIYFPPKKRVGSIQQLQKEHKKNEYLSLWGSFHHKVRYNKDGGLSSGGNHMKLFGGCKDSDLEIFFQATKYKIPSLFKALEPVLLRLESEDPLETVSSSIIESVYRIVNTGIVRCKAEIPYLVNFIKKEKLKKMKEISDDIQSLVEETLGIEKILDSDEVEEVNKKALSLKYHASIKALHNMPRRLKRYDSTKKTLWRIRKNLVYDTTELTRLLIKPLTEFCKSTYGRRVIIHRPMVSVAKLMANNLNIIPVRKWTKYGDRTFHEYRDSYIVFEPLKKDIDMWPKFTKTFEEDARYRRLSESAKDKRMVKTSTLLKLLIDVAIAGDFKELFMDVFDLLYMKNFDTREKYLLI